MWNSLEDNYLHELASSMKRRMQAIDESDGDVTDHCLISTNQL